MLRDVPSKSKGQSGISFLFATCESLFPPRSFANVSFPDVHAIETGEFMQQGKRKQMLDSQAEHLNP
jgi:hypothetical protein